MALARLMAMVPMNISAYITSMTVRLIPSARPAQGSPANWSMAMVINPSTSMAGHASQPAKAGISIPAKPATKLTAMAIGIIGNITKFDNGATTDKCPNIKSMSGRVRICAMNDSINKRIRMDLG